MEFNKEDFVNAYPEQKHIHDDQYFWMGWVSRKQFFVIAKLMICFRVPPNIITLISIAFALLGFFLSFGNGIGFSLVCAFCFHLWLLGDCVDGIVARHFRISSTFGALLDDMGYYFACVCFWLSVAVLASLEATSGNPGNFYDVIMKITSMNYLNIGMCILLALLLRDIFGLLLSVNNGETGSRKSVNVSDREALPTYWLKIRAFLWFLRTNLSSLVGFQIPFFFIFILVDKVTIFLFLGLYVHILDLFLKIFVLSRRAIRYD